MVINALLGLMTLWAQLAMFDKTVSKQPVTSNVLFTLISFLKLDLLINSPSALGCTFKHLKNPDGLNQPHSHDFCGWDN